MADRLSHTEDAGGSNPSSSTVAEVEVDDTPGRGPGGSRFESGRSLHTAGDLGSARPHKPRPAGSIPAPATTGRGATGSAAPLHGEGCGFESRPVHHIADVAQLEEARRSDRRQCRVRLRPSVPALDVAQRERTGFGSRGLEVRVLPSRPTMRGGGTGTTPGSEPGEPGSIPGLAAIRCLCSLDRPAAQAGVPSDHGVAGSSPVVHSVDVAQSVEHMHTPAALVPRPNFPFRSAAKDGLPSLAKRPSGLPFDSAPPVHRVP